ncbi:MAG: protoheme IX farnesyltransferase [Candidatus Omnitrophica bacterium]|nr:protoheme IX farnesyltransferase [Candidatus Omnitrophota bacterium]
MNISILQNYWELTKPRLVSLVLLSTVVGFVMAEKGSVDWKLLMLTLFGTALTAAGSMALNQWMESDRDAMMKRTAVRPIPQKRISRPQALLFGGILSLTGVALLYTFVNPISSGIAAATILSYLLVYTPLKVKTVYSTLVGALPGALPPLIGWAASRGELNFQGWTLFAIVFFWQMPHFLALSWMLRDQYKVAGFRMLAVLDPDGKQVFKEMVFYSIVMVPVSVLPSFVGLTGIVYGGIMLILSLGFLFLLWKDRNQFNEKARFLFRMSLLYLSILLIVMMIDKQ